jgi:hypothetical protein
MEDRPMTRTHRGQGTPTADEPVDPAPAEGTGGFVGQIGLFETGNGIPVGPVEIALAVLAAVLIYPVMRLVRVVRGR